MDTGAQLPARRTHGPAVSVATRGGKSTIRAAGRVVFSAEGRLGGVSFSPSGTWVTVTWPTADQLVFVRVRGRPKLLAVSNLTRQFGAGASVRGWVG